MNNATTTNDDTELLDFLADPKQRIANVTLPRDIIEHNVSSMRDAIREAKERHEANGGNQ